MTPLSDILPALPANRIEDMQGGASSKRFFRIRSGPDEWRGVLIRFGDEPACREYLAVADCLMSNQIPIPTVRHSWTDRHAVLVDDLGDQTLLRQFDTSESTYRLYEDLLDHIIRIQSIPSSDTLPFQRVFDEQKYRYEFSFHMRERLIDRHARYRLTSRQHDDLEQFHLHLTSVLLRDPPRLAHRDFQSSNILLQQRQPHLIDFQDALLASPYYDLVSLLEDAYVAVPDAWKEKLKTRFAGSLSGGWQARSYDYCLIQRKLHDAGAFAYTYQKLGNPRYLQYISVVLQQAIAVLERYSEFEPACHLWKEVIRYGNSREESQSPVDLL